MSSKSLARKNRFKFKYLRQLKGFRLRISGQAETGWKYFWRGRPNGNGRTYNNMWGDVAYVFKLPRSFCKQDLKGVLDHHRPISEPTETWTVSPHQHNFYQAWVAEMMKQDDDKVEKKVIFNDVGMPPVIEQIKDWDLDKILPFPSDIFCPTSITEIKTPTIEEQYKTIHELNRQDLELPEFIAWELPKGLAIDGTNYSEHLIDRNRLIPSDKEYQAITTAISNDPSKRNRLKAYGKLILVDKETKAQYIVIKVSSFEETNEPFKPEFLGRCEDITTYNVEWLLNPPKNV